MSKYNFKELEKRFFGSEYELVKDLSPHEKLQRALGLYPFGDEQREMLGKGIGNMSVEEAKETYQLLVEALIIDHDGVMEAVREVEKEMEGSLEKKLDE